MKRLTKHSLEIKRTSITRLKQFYEKSQNSKKRQAWNQKNLDYEIETVTTAQHYKRVMSWNQKNLDYEIETKSM